MKDVPVDHVSQGDRNTGSEEVGTSLQCPFPLPSEPQHLAWLDLCQQECLSTLSWQSWSVGAGQAMVLGPYAFRGTGSQGCSWGRGDKAIPLPGAGEGFRDTEEVRPAPPLMSIPRGQVHVFPLNTDALRLVTQSCPTLLAQGL